MLRCPSFWNSEVRLIFFSLYLSIFNAEISTLVLENEKKKKKKRLSEDIFGIKKKKKKK